MKKRLGLDRDQCRKYLKRGVIVVNGTLLCVLTVPFCMLFFIIDMIWLLTDVIIRKLDKQ